MRSLALFGLIFGLAQISEAGTNLPVRLEPGAEGSISVRSCFETLPGSGYAPLSIAISNDSTQPHRWSFFFDSPAYAYFAVDSMQSNVELEVHGKSARVFNVLAPLVLRGDENFSPIAVTTVGPWAGEEPKIQFPMGNRNGKPSTTFVAMSNSLAVDSWGKLEKELNLRGFGLRGSKFEPAELPEDWRGYAGISGLWLSTLELGQLSAAQRQAVHEWVCLGGWLFVAGSQDLPPDFNSSGFGVITKLPAGNLDINATATSIEELDLTSLERQVGHEYENWQKTRDLGEIKLSTPLLMTLISVFGVVVGPLNLYVFARSRRRHRLFWTTPLISVGASIGLVVLIVLQDGLGGAGQRVALVCLQPTEKTAAILQEQFSRTGVLLSSSFTAREPEMIIPIALDTRPNAVKRKYQNSGSLYGGEWFVSRSIQAHWLESIRPMRAGVILANAVSAEAQVAPVIVSNIGTRLDQFYFRDSEGLIWSARDVPTGEHVTLHKEDKFPDLLPREAGPRLRRMWQRVATQNEFFYAVSRQNSSLLDTLPSIRWRNDQLIYVGPLKADEHLP